MGRWSTWILLWEDDCGLHNAFLYEDFSRGPYGLELGKVRLVISRMRLRYHSRIEKLELPTTCLYPSAEFLSSSYSTQSTVSWPTVLNSNSEETSILMLWTEKKINCKRMASCAMRVDKTLSLANY